MSDFSDLSLAEVLVTSISIQLAAMYWLAPSTKFLMMRVKNLQMDVTRKTKINLRELQTVSERNPMILQVYYVDSNLYVYTRVISFVLMIIVWVLIGISLMSASHDSTNLRVAAIAFNLAFGLVTVFVSHRASMITNIVGGLEGGKI